jgi:hypothetical protein
MMKQLILCIGILILGFTNLKAQDEPEGQEEKYIQEQSVSLIIDQDAFSGYNEDRNYTMGISIGYAGKFADNDWLLFPWLRKKADWLFGFKGLHQSGEQFLPAIAIFFSGFTPENIAAAEPVINDRPYSSIMGISSFRSTLMNGFENEIDQYAFSTRLNIGILGLNIGRDVQTHIHREMWIGSTRPIPLGWHNQISQGGEPTALYQMQFSKPAFIAYGLNSEGQEVPRKKLELMYIAECNVGYYNNIAVGTVFRIGRYYTPFWYLNSSGMSSINQTALMAPKFEFFFTFGIRARAVLYNVLLQGQFRNTEHRLYYNEISPLIFESEFGIVMRYKKLSLIVHPFQLRTSEVRLPTSRTHIWGSASLIYSF